MMSIFVQRRQQVYHVKVAPETTTQQELDLNRVEEERFPAEKTRMTLERFYVSVVIGVRESLNHVVRLRSWKEPGRTSMYSAVRIPIIPTPCHGVPGWLTIPGLFLCMGVGLARSCVDGYPRCFDLVSADPAVAFPPCLCRFGF